MHIALTAGMMREAVFCFMKVLRVFSLKLLFKFASETVRCGHSKSFEQKVGDFWHIIG